MAERQVALVLGKRSQNWYAQLDEANRDRVLESHGEQLRQYADQVTHVICTGTSAYDEVIIIEADDADTIQKIVGEFRSSEKAGFYQIVDCILGVKPANIRGAHHYYH